ncbi:MAG TPA: prepilin-type N-terminal cleavage/methylation domain-containing protein [Verrucomicrobiae bacterium]|nr:prepilin-type N-terminal cleavage/methylation domain-containing protein [Verrucomicrobiae bacterium]
MKTINRDLWRVTSDETGVAGAGYSRHPSPVTRHAWAFTLIELLVVISIIAVLAALILPVGAMVKRHAFLQTAQAEMSQIETAIDRYHSAYGFYPPSGTGGPLTNQLYFELVGTTNNAGTFQTLDGSAEILAADANLTFGMSGFMNCNKPNADESAPRAQNFLPDLKPLQIAILYTNATDIVKILVASAGGPDTAYQPLGIQNVNPWRYNSSSPTNNPGSYDLYVQLKIAGKTYLICNWSKQVQVNNPLP